MKRLPFQRPTNLYHERIVSIDDRICKLIKQRNEISDNNPGFPETKYIQQSMACMKISSMYC